MRIDEVKTWSKNIKSAHGWRLKSATIRVCKDDEGEEQVTVFDHEHNWLVESPGTQFNAKRLARELTDLGIPTVYDNGVTKRQFLLSVAVDAVNWGEGADFEWRELVTDSDLVRRFYPELFSEWSIDKCECADLPDGYATLYDGSVEKVTAETCECDASPQYIPRKVYDAIHSDVVDLLESLKDQ